MADRAPAPKTAAISLSPWSGTESGTEPPSALKQLGVELAKKALERHGFTSVSRIQEDERLVELKDGRKRRLWFGTLLAAKKRKKYIFEVVTRRKYQKNGELNPRYILVRSENYHEISGKDSPVEKHYRAVPHWIAVRFDSEFIWHAEFSAQPGHTDAGRGPRNV